MSDNRWTLRGWWRRRPERVPLWWMGNAKRWDDYRLMVLKDRGLTEEDVDDPRMPC